MGSRGASSKSANTKKCESYLYVNSIYAKNKTLNLSSYKQAKEMVNWLENEAKKTGRAKEIIFSLGKSKGKITAYSDGFGISKEINSFTLVGLGNWNISKKEVLKHLKEFDKEVDTKGLVFIN